MTRSLLPACLPKILETAGLHRFVEASCKKKKRKKCSFCEQITKFICPPQFGQRSGFSARDSEQKRLSDASHQREQELHLLVDWFIVSDSMTKLRYKYSGDKV